MNQESLDEESLQGVDTIDDKSYRLVLYNDDFHSFDYVIDALMDICEHTYEQAFQCTLLTHHKGKCVVKNGGMELLKPMHNALINKGLKTEII